MKKVLSLLMAFMLCLGVFTLVGGVNTVKAAEDDIASGVYDDVDWRITSEGELIIGDGTEKTFTERVSRDRSHYPWLSYANIKSVRFDGVVHGNGGMPYMFSKMANVTSFDFHGFETSRVTDMSWMFCDDDSVSNLDLSGFDTSNVTSMECMFADCRVLSSVDVSSFNTSNVTTMKGMFCASPIRELDVRHFDTHNVTNVAGMFNDTRLEYLDLSNFDTSNVSTFDQSINFIGGYSTYYTGFLGNCGSLQKIVFGNNITTFKKGQYSNSQILLFTPGKYDKRYTGKWIREDGKYGPYTAAEMVENYTSEMAGAWVWEVTDIPYAVFDETTGALNFVRAKEVHTDNSTGTVKSISGDEYTGTIFTIKNSTTEDPTWKSIASQVKKVQFIGEVKPTSTYRWFANFSNCNEFDLKKLDTSDVTSMRAMFESCGNVKSLDISHFNTSQVTNMTYVFNGCSKLEKLDISGFDTRKTTNMCGMFYSCSLLKEVKLGDNFSFKGNDIEYTGYQAILQPPSSIAPYTGKWIREDKAYGPFYNGELRDKYTSEMAGTWIWELAPVEYTISFEAGENGTGAMQSVSAPATEDFTLPANQFAAFGYTFDHWDDGNGKTYADNGTIPANTYVADQKVTLTAIWKKRDTSLNWDGNEATFSIRGGEQAVLDNIPAGTSYQVYELTPDGWVLVQQENASGVIDALEESAAAFWNKYQPGVTTVQFSGLKNLDGRPADAGKFTFELYEGETLVDTATTQDGGFLQFKVIEYDAAGDHVYTIREVDPNDDTIDYDTHEETVEVSVTDNGDGTLSSEVKYDDDGIVFSNATRPGTLRITKDATNGTSANADDKFTIEIEFRNESGMPINDNIYWYIEGDSSPSDIDGGNQE